MRNSYLPGLHVPCDLPLRAGTRRRAVQPRRGDMFAGDSLGVIQSGRGLPVASAYSVSGAISRSPSHVSTPSSGFTCCVVLIPRLQLCLSFFNRLSCNGLEGAGEALAPFFIAGHLVHKNDSVSVGGKPHPLER